MFCASRQAVSEILQRLTVAAAVAFSGPSWSYATTPIVDTDGFEAGWALGPLLGQQGWIFSGQGAGNAVVQNGLVESGFKALRVDRGSNSDDRWLLPVGGLGFPENRYVLIDWDMHVLGTGSPSGFGPFFGVDAYDDSGAGAAVLGSLGVDATTGDVLYQEGGTGFLVESGSTAAFNQWHSFRIRLDFLDDEYTTFFNGVEIATTDFVDGASDAFTDADVAAFAAAADAVSQSMAGIGYFDNFLVRDVSGADFDIDGDVDEDDFVLWEPAFGPSNGADTDLDGDTDGFDFLVIQRDFESNGVIASPSAVGVPEPATLTATIVCFASLGCIRLRWSRTG